ncbi:MAG: 4-(cytidine 5'-diphospho)-2-C-methyl-D-erythritol kinase [Thermodesulfovibrionia bacterium]
MFTHHPSLSLRAYAKINWFLKVLELRADGYHEIRSLIQKVTLYDVLEFSLSDGLTLKTDMALPIEDNLVYKTMRLMKDRYNVKDGVTIRLKKDIPIGAGLGGGSSDAAVTLIGLNELWSLNLSHNDLFGLAEGLGSDVPFFLHGAMAYVEGRGERVAECNAINPIHILLVKPHLSISTAWAYRRLSELRAGELTKIGDNVDNIEAFINCVRRVDIGCIGRYSDTALNDLESASLREYPVIGEIKYRLLQEGAVFSLMSGSGPTVFGVFESEGDAMEASRSFGDYWTAVVKTII